MRLLWTNPMPTKSGLQYSRCGRILNMSFTTNSKWLILTDQNGSGSISPAATWCTAVLKYSFQLRYFRMVSFWGRRKSCASPVAPFLYCRKLNHGDRLSQASLEMVYVFCFVLGTSRNARTFYESQTIFIS